MDDSWGFALTEHFLVSYNTCGCIDMNIFLQKTELFSNNNDF